MEIIIYRHAKPTVSDDEIISGHDFPEWVQKYDQSGIDTYHQLFNKEEIVFTSNLERSKKTGQLIGQEVIEVSLFREAEIPLIRFPAIRLKAKIWILISRILWLLGIQKSCESFKKTKFRVKQAVDNLELHLHEKSRLVVIGHGFINRMIKKELLNRGWSQKEPMDGHGFLSKMTFETERNN